MSRESRAGARVFVGRLSHRATERDVEKFFKGYGRIREINMKNGFAFIEFDDYRDADDAVHDLNNKDMSGERVTVEHARPTRPSNYRSGSGGRDYGGRSGGPRPFTFRDKYGAPYNTEWRVLVTNLSTRVGWQDLKDFMRQVGDVTFTQCHKDRVGEGIVEFSCEDDMSRAIKRLDGSDLMGKRISCCEAKGGAGSRGGKRRHSGSRSPRRYSRSPRRSGSRSPRRSRSPRSLSRSPRRSRSLSPRQSPQRSPHRSPSPLGTSQTQPRNDLD